MLITRPGLRILTGGKVNKKTLAGKMFVMKNVSFINVRSSGILLNIAYLHSNKFKTGTLMIQPGFTSN